MIVQIFHFIIGNIYHANIISLDARDPSHKDSRTLDQTCELVPKFLKAKA